MTNEQNLYTISKAKLLDILKKNRDLHARNYKQACVEYKKQAERALERQLNNIKEGREFELTFNLPRPVNYTKQYDKIIGLLELSNESERRITESEYTQYVLDDWNWKANFYANSMSYLGVGASAEENDDTE